MQLSDLLLEKLNSDASLSKRIQLAKNVFISTDLRTAYKEEYVLTWFLHKILESGDEEEKKKLMNGFCFCINTDIMTLLPASGIRANAKSDISKCIYKILRKIQSIDKSVTEAILIILKKFFLHFKSHPKQYMKVLSALLNLDLVHTTEIFHLTLDIFKSGALHDKFFTCLVQKEFHVFFKNKDNENNPILIQFLQKMFFNKEIMTEFEKMLHSICSGHEILANNQIKALVSSLYSTYISNVDVAVKSKTFSTILEAFIKSGNEDSISILQFFIVLCHILGLEQRVTLQLHSDSEKPSTVINCSHFENAFEISTIEANETSFVIVDCLIQCLSSYSPDLNTTLSDSTYFQWFQSLVVAGTNHGKLSKVHLNFFCTCSEFNTSLIEKNFNKIFSSLLNLPLEAFEDEDFQITTTNFMNKMLMMYSKLQRVQKFISKLLQSIRNTPSELKLKNLFCNKFIHEFSKLITLMPSMQSLMFMDDMLKTMNEHCVKTLEENNDSVNVLLVQVTCALLSSFLCGIRVLSHMTPRGIQQSFIEKNNQLKQILGHFGRALLVRIHDREIVQPFLNLCFYWGEVELLIMCYVEDEELVNKDISPPDLSTLHSYLSGEEWNVLAERVSNFGAEQCYQLFLKLVLQKLRTLQLKNCTTLINGEATSRHILTQLTCELYKHNIVEELTPEDIVFLLNHLSPKLSRTLLDKFYSQLADITDSEKLIEWIKNSVLLENHNFILLSLVLIFKKISSKINSNKHYGSSVIPFQALALEFLTEDYNIDKEQYFKLVRHLNELLDYGNGFSIDGIISKQVKVFIDVLKMLPLVHMSTEVSALALSGFVFLAIIFSSAKELVNPLLLLIYNLTIVITKKSSFSCFDIGLLIKWLLYLETKCEDSQRIKNKLIKLLLRNSSNIENGLVQLKELVSVMGKKKLKDDPKALEHQILLYQDLGKSWVKSKKRNKENDDISKFRRKLSKRIRKELENQNGMDNPTADDRILVSAYAIELTRAIKLKNNENIISLINLNFDKFFDVAVANVKKNGSKEEDDSYVMFLTTVLIHMPEIKDHLRKTTLKKIWNTLKTHSNVDWKLFYKIADEEEFESFLLDLIKLWRVFAAGKNYKMNLESYFDIWKEFHNTDNSNQKKLYEKYLKRLFVQFSAVMASVNNCTPEQIVQVYSFIRFCIRTSDVSRNNEIIQKTLIQLWNLNKLVWVLKTKLRSVYAIIVMTSSMLDSSIDFMYNYDYKEGLSIKDFQKIFECCINACSWSLTTRSVRMKDKIQNVFQLFTKLLDALVKRSNSASYLPEEDLLALASCSHNMEKWSSKMVKYNKDFSRTSVYFIAVLISCFVKTSIYPAVKTPLVNCIHNFLSISDSHNIAHLMRVFNPGSQQVFSGIYETYKKYYKFTGKV